MSENASVVVFPSIFAQNKINSLVSNIKKILKIKNQKYQEIRRDDSLIVVDAMIHFISNKFAFWN